MAPLGGKTPEQRAPMTDYSRTTPAVGTADGNKIISTNKSKSKSSNNKSKNKSSSNNNKTTKPGIIMKKAHSLTKRLSSLRRQQHQQHDHSEYQSGKEEKIHQIHLPPAGSSSPSHRPRSGDDVRDGKFFHIRLTLGYLTGLVISQELPKGEDAGAGGADDSFLSESTAASITTDPTVASPANTTTTTTSADPVVSVYASFAEGEDRGEYNFAQSLPVKNSPRQTAEWPNPIANNQHDLLEEDVTSVVSVKTSNRRLYHSILLRADDCSPSAAVDEFDEDDQLLDNRSLMSCSVTPATRYAPEHVPLYLGLAKGKEKIPLGVATLVVNGRETYGQRMDLPIRPVAFSKEGGPKKLPKKYAKGFKKLLGMKNAKGGSAQRIHFLDDDRRFSVARNGVLRMKVDVQSGVYERNGPGLWGDLNDDEESFGPLPVIDIPDDGTGELTNRYVHESIEVMCYPSGTTILSSPGVGFAEETYLSTPTSTPPRMDKLPSYVSDVTKSNNDERAGSDKIIDSPGPGFMFCGNVSHINEDEIKPMVQTQLSFDGTNRYRVSPASTQETPTREALLSRGALGSNDTEDAPDYDDETDGFSADDDLNTEDENPLIRYASRLGEEVEELLGTQDSADDEDDDDLEEDSEDTEDDDDDDSEDTEDDETEDDTSLESSHNTSSFSRHYADSTITTAKSAMFK